jgi:hypothetical protein
MTHATRFIGQSLFAIAACARFLATCSLRRKMPDAAAAYVRA